mgnify:CR=1 FL=1
MKKKYPATPKDKKDWIAFTKRLENIYDKDNDFIKQNTTVNKIKKLDLHGFSLIESNKIVKKFVVESFERGYKKLLIITGRGQRSNSYDNPYISKKLGVLRYSVPEFIKNDESLNSKINRISVADIWYLMIDPEVNGLCSTP